MSGFKEGGKPPLEGVIKFPERAQSSKEEKKQPVTRAEKIKEWGADRIASNWGDKYEIEHRFDNPKEAIAYLRRGRITSGTFIEGIRFSESRYAVVLGPAEVKAGTYDLSGDLHIEGELCGGAVAVSIKGTDRMATMLIPKEVILSAMERGCGPVFIAGGKMEKTDEEK